MITFFISFILLLIGSLISMWAYSQRKLIKNFTLAASAVMSGIISVLLGYILYKILNNNEMKLFMCLIVVIAGATIKLDLQYTINALHDNSEQSLEKQFNSKVDMQTFENINKRLQPQQSTFTQDVKAGVHRTITGIKNSHFFDTLFNGYLFPDATPEETQQYLEAEANYYRAQREALQFNEQYEGTADSITASLVAGASQVFLQGLAAGLISFVATPFGGLAYIMASTAAQEASNKLQEWQEDYQNKHGGSLEGFDYTKEGLAALAHGAIAGFIKSALDNK